jgi:hypothetical protein
MTLILASLRASSLKLMRIPESFFIASTPDLICVFFCDLRGLS